MLSDWWNLSNIHKREKTQTVLVEIQYKLLPVQKRLCSCVSWSICKFFQLLHSLCWCHVLTAGRVEPLKRHALLWLLVMERMRANHPPQVPLLWLKAKAISRLEIGLRVRANNRLSLLNHRINVCSPHHIHSHAVVVRAPNGVSFKGLLVQAVDPSTNQPIGTFEPGRGLKTIDSCSAVTHSDARGKRSATLVWDAPQGTAGRVAFKSTLVKRFSEFWTGIEADENPNIWGSKAWHWLHAVDLLFSKSTGWQSVS